MGKQQPVDEVFGIPIYFNPIREKFTASFKERDYESDRLSDIKRELEADKPLELEESVIYASSGEMVLTTIIEISPHGSLRPRERMGFGVSPNPDGHKEIFPRSMKNMEIYNRHKAMREKGWALIHQADEMYQELEAYPRNYWKEKAKELKT